MIAGGKVRPTHDDRRRLRGDGAGDRGRFHRLHPQRDARQPAQPRRRESRSRHAADRRRGIAARHSAADRLRRDPRPPHALPGAARGGRDVRPADLGAHGARSRARDRGRRPRDDVRADARRLARSSLGTNGRGPRRRSLARGADRARESPRLPGRRPRRRRIGRRDRQALLRVWTLDRRARLRVRRRFGAHAARGASSGLRGGG